MKTDVTMIDYILEEKDVLLRLIDDRKNLTENFVSLMKQRDIKELILCGSGTSYHAGMATRRLIEKLLQIRVRAELPEVFVSQQAIYDPNTLFFGISQSGGSLSTMNAMEKAKSFDIPIGALSENENALIFSIADTTILMNIGPELSVAKTKGYTATMVILWLAALEASLSLNRISTEEYNLVLNRLIKTVQNYDRIIPRAIEWAEGISEELKQSQRILVLGYENNYATVLEGALKMLETMRFGIYGYELEEFCHGIYNSIKDDTFIFYLASSGHEQNRLLDIKRVIDETTSHQFVICSQLENYEPGKRDGMFPFLEDEDFSVLEYILPLQIISATLPYQLGINPFYASDPTFHARAKSKQVLRTGK